MDVFEFRDSLIGDYSEYVGSFMKVRDDRIRERVEAAGLNYETALDPPPADPSLAHPESTRPAWAMSTEHDGEV